MPWDRWYSQKNTCAPEGTAPAIASVRTVSPGGMSMATSVPSALKLWSADPRFVSFRPCPPSTVRHAGTNSLSTSRIVTSGLPVAVASTHSTPSGGVGDGLPSVGANVASGVGDSACGGGVASSAQAVRTSATTMIVRAIEASIIGRHGPRGIIDVPGRRDGQGPRRDPHEGPRVAVEPTGGRGGHGPSDPGRRGRARGASRIPRHAFDQTGVEAVRPRPGRALRRSDHARGGRYARQGHRGVLEGGPPRPNRLDHPLGGGGVRIPRPGAGGGRAASRNRGQGGQRGRRIPIRPGAAGRAPRRDSAGGAGGGRRDRYRAEPFGVPLRQVPPGVRGDHAVQGGLWHGAPEGDPRDRRARVVRPGPQGLHAGHGRRSGLHQDLDRQDRLQRHACRRPVHDGGRPGLPPPDRSHRRRQGRRGHPEGQGGLDLPGDPPRDARPGLADPGPVPVRCLHAAQRPADADPQGARGPVPGTRLLHGRLMPERERDELERRKEAASSALAERTPFAYASAPESSEIVRIEDRYGLFIGGEFVEPKSGRWFGTLNPATEEVLSEVAEAGPEDVDLAVTTARAAWEESWRDLPGRERAKYMYRIARQLQERSREFAVLETIDGGKPIKESRDVDVPLAAAHFFYYAGWADKLDYAFPGRLPRPIGVAGQVIPWNFPLLMAAWKLAPALATGNTVVLKPAETTPLTAL